MRRRRNTQLPQSIPAFGCQAFAAETRHFDNSVDHLAVADQFCSYGIGLVFGNVWILTEREVAEAVAEVERGHGWNWREEADRYEDEDEVALAEND